MREKWFQKNRQADFALLAREAGINEVTARVIVNRGIDSMESFWQYVRPELTSLASPFRMRDMDKAVDILVEKLSAGAAIRIVGDYDVDGVMSTYILYKGLRRAAGSCPASADRGNGAGVGAVSRIDYEIPDRILDGYGINVSIIDAAAADGVDTILTCDNGIAAASQIAHGKELGMTVVVTDHHDIPFEITEKEIREILPPADAVVNPKQSACGYPFKSLCGAGVAWQLVRGLYERCGIPAQEAEELLDAVALATVCDVMDLLGENRILVRHGLKRLERTENLGLQTLLTATNMEGKELSAYHCGFIIGPCINASGRLESAKQGLRLLLTSDPAEAKELAASLVALNEERKELTAEGVEQAVEQAERFVQEGDQVLVIYLPDCHESIAGIIAGRIRERFYRPTLILTKGEPFIKGSGRSIPEYNMFEHLTMCSELFSKFGGHPLAAGFSLTGDTERYVETLRRTMNAQAKLTEEDLLPKVSFDQVLGFSGVTEELIEEFGMLAPFGKGNGKPLFAIRDVSVRQAKILGKNRNVVRLSMREGDFGKEYQGIVFTDGDVFTDYIAEKYDRATAERLFEGGTAGVKLDLVFCPEINEYQGYRNIQMVVEHYR